MSRSHHDPMPVSPRWEQPLRLRLDVSGRVQGVGFRPSIFRLAQGIGVRGVVGNNSRGAFIEIEGTRPQIDDFLKRLPTVLPSLAEIHRIDNRPMSPVGDDTFRIVESEEHDHERPEITPDLCVCGHCLSELMNAEDRRHRYALINCMHCGPRYSILRTVPYDRANTTMAGFKMCPACQSEYDDPADRRFHAQPNACPRCGPHIWLLDRERQEVEGDPIRTAARWLACGAIIAVKGIGGFHLACCAEDDRAVAALRSRKARDLKPLAIMCESLEEARKYGEIDDVAAAALMSPAHPIVLVPRRPRTPLSPRVAPGVSSIGIMLPYTPVHHLLLAEGIGSLVMTSANLSDEPLAFENEDALKRLSKIADGFLMHNRPIERRVDDSVLLSTGIPEAPIVPLRRARGYVPSPIRLREPITTPILSLGGDLKSTVCIAGGDMALLSEHFGDLVHPAAYRNYLNTIPHLSKLLRVEPQLFAHDLHPDYCSTRYAMWNVASRRVGVQHHHAHIVSCMADNSVTGRVVGIACDGTGFGTDRAIWGCEILVCDEADFERAAHLRYFRLPGGDSAASETWRPAVSLLRQACGRDWRLQLPKSTRDRLPEGVELYEQRLSAAHDVPETSSLGRLFDAAAWLLGLCEANQYEAQAALALEAAAELCPSSAPLCFDILEPAGQPMQLDVHCTIQDLLTRQQGGATVPELARAFHDTVALMLVEAALRVSERENVPRVALSGGCFANRILLHRVLTGLRDAGREVFVHHRVPPGDGGLSLGQAVVAAARQRSM